MIWEPQGDYPRIGTRHRPGRRLRGGLLRGLNENADILGPKDAAIRNTGGPGGTPNRPQVSPTGKKRWQFRVRTNMSPTVGRTNSVQAAKNSRPLITVPAGRRRLDVGGERHCTAKVAQTTISSAKTPLQSVR